MAKVVLGGGIAGLSTAYYLGKCFLPECITLLEASNRSGGWIQSIKNVNGVIFEQSARTLRPTGSVGLNTLKLIEEVGLEGDIVAITSQHPAVQNRMVYANGKLHTLPSNITDIFRTRSPFSKPLIYYALTDLFAQSKKNADESIYSFAERRFGKEIADYAVSPLVCGICAGDAKNISVKFLMEGLFAKEQKYGSIAMGLLRERKKKTNMSDLTHLQRRALTEKWRIYTLNDGLETLPKRLEKICMKNNIKIMHNTPCIKLKFMKNSTVSVLHSKGEIITNNAISALPAHKLADVLDGHQTLADLLKSIPVVDVCVVNLNYKGKVLDKDGFGFLVCPDENIPILGTIFDSCYSQSLETTTLTVMMGGHWFKKYFGTNPTEDFMLDTALKQVNNILHIEEPPSLYKVSILRECIPQYIVGHQDTIKKINDYIVTNELPLHLCGNSYYGVGVNDVILSAKNCVKSIERTNDVDV